MQHLVNLCYEELSGALGSAADLRAAADYISSTVGYRAAYEILHADSKFHYTEYFSDLDELLYDSTLPSNIAEAMLNVALIEPYYFALRDERCTGELKETLTQGVDQGVTDAFRVYACTYATPHEAHVSHPGALQLPPQFRERVSELMTSRRLAQVVALRQCLQHQWV